MFSAKTVIVGSLFLASLFFGSVIRANEKRALYDKAVSLTDEGQFKEAAALFRKVQQLDKTFRYYYNVGQCEYKAKRYGPAIEAFEAFLKGAGKDKTLEKARKHALEAIEELTPLVGFLEIETSEPVDVWVDDTQRGATPLDEPLRLGEGEHSVVIKKDNKEIAAKSVTIERGKTNRVAFLQGADAEAKAEFNRGIALYNADLYEDAAAAFRKANELKPAWPLFFNIGQSEAAAKRYGLAYEAFQEYLAHGGDDISKERQSLVESELTRLEGLVGSLKIVAPKGATVYIDGTARGIAPLPGKPKIAVGMIHGIEIIQDEKTILARRVKISRGETIVLTVGHKGNGKDANPETNHPPLTRG